jgi:penicillin-binding protein 2
MNQFSTRQIIIGGIMVLVFLIYIGRLFYIQIIDPTYKYSAENNSQRYVTQYPARGLIFDRKGKLLVSNMAAYDLMVNRRGLKAFDTLELATILGLDLDQFDKILFKIKNNNDYIFKSAQFLSQLSDSTYALLQEKLYKFPGFFVQPRTLRTYNVNIAAHLFGYVGEVDSAIIKKNPYYKIGDYIGMSGLEKAYEPELRGKKGVNIFLVDVHNRVKGSLQNGRFDTAAVMGKNVTCTIDADLQRFGEMLMHNFHGSVVAIEPSTGEVLALISTPNYDPNLLVGRVRSKNYNFLRQDPNLPLFNRAVMPKYPPGSTFKLVNALIALKENVVTTEDKFYCYQGYTAGPIHVACHIHPTPLDMRHGIQNSCNAYFDNVFRRIIENPEFPKTADAYSEWRKYVLTFGFGKKLNTDFPNELASFIPTSSFYDKIYGRNGWKSLTILSLAIGQGEIGVTPLHLANLSATVANRGFYYIPHTVKKIEGLDTINSRFTEKHYTAFDSSYYRPIVDGMYLAVNDGGTAWDAAVKGLDICGKTGTAQNPHGEDDNSIFIAFAPKDHPKIAISVYIEYGGFGATYAGPVASLMIEKYLTDSISRPYMIDYLKKARINYPISKK